jgi:hypothetical protein
MVRRQCGGEKGWDQMSPVLRSFKAPGAIGALLMAMLLTLSACAGRTDELPYAPPSFNVEPDSPFTVNPDYRLGPTDLVNVTVFRATDRPATIGRRRRQHRPPLSERRSGRRPGRRAIKRNLGTRYYVDPQVTVALRETNSQRICVDGSVQAPGLIRCPGADAGGPWPWRAA